LSVCLFVAAACDAAADVGSRQGLLLHHAACCC
jgi:hypothetical protein